MHQSQTHPKKRCTHCMSLRHCIYDTESRGRMMLSAAAVPVMLLVLVAAAGVTAAEVPLVDTEDGRVSGIVEESVKDREFYSFYGIPFARPPLGKLRFKDPEPLPAWEGTREASVPAPPCLQLSFVAELMGKIEALGEEDCLYLNVFTQKLGDVAHYPAKYWT